MNKHECSGIKTTGYWKGYQCAAIGKYEHKGKWYCANHLVTAMGETKSVIVGMEDSQTEEKVE